MRIPYIILSLLAADLASGRRLGARRGPATGSPGPGDRGQGRRGQDVRGPVDARGPGTGGWTIARSPAEPAGHLVSGDRQPAACPGDSGTPLRRPGGRSGGTVQRRPGPSCRWPARTGHGPARALCAPHPQLGSLSRPGTPPGTAESLSRGLPLSATLGGGGTRRFRSPIGGSPLCRAAQTTQRGRGAPIRSRSEQPAGPVAVGQAATRQGRSLRRSGDAQTAGGESAPADGVGCAAYAGRRTRRSRTICGSRGAVAGLGR